MPSDSDDSDDRGPDLPAGVLRSRGGWQGDALEIEHQRERLRAADAADGRSAPRAHAAVDLAQFRNEEVGRGYQAKHVVRQRESTRAATEVVDMSDGRFAKKAPASKKRSRDDRDEDGEDRSKTKPPADDRLESYLQCKGMRDFVKEMSQILTK